MVDPRKSSCRLVILISGRGSNMQTIVNTVKQQGLPATVCAVISNRADAAGLDWARAQGVEARALPHKDFPTRQEFDVALSRLIDEYEPDYVLLAGFMRVLTPAFVERYEGRLLNIHPSLLPAFPGLHTHDQALAMGMQWHGCTVHFVTAQLDHGPIVAQGVVPVLAGDDAHVLADRLLALEHRVYGEVVKWLAQGRVSLDGHGLVQVEGVASRAFLPDGARADVAEIGKESS